jgi:hypothetical protein
MVLAQSSPFPPVRQSAKVVSPDAASAPDPKAQAGILDSYGKLPLSFEANQGQTDRRVTFLSHGSGYTLFLTGDEAVFSLRGSKANGDASPASRQLKRTTFPTTNAVLRMKLVNANREAKATGADELPGKSNYFIGNDPKKWRSNVTNFTKVKYEGIYSGIDLVYYGNQRQLEYDFVVKPGADPHRIQFDVGGAKSISRNKNGDLVLHMAEGEVHWHKPVVYQEMHGKTKKIATRYVIKHGHRLGFEVASYDARRALVIDPALGYSTYLGGSDFDVGAKVAVDASGNAYVTGSTASTNFPTTSGAVQTKYGGGTSDAFVTKLNLAGSALVFSSYLGGNSLDGGDSIALDASGNTYIAGVTQSADFPTTPGAFQTKCGGSCAENGFVAKLNPTGSALVYSTYLGGSMFDAVNSMVINPSGNSYVTGYATSSDFPTTPGAFQTSCAKNRTCSFVTEFDSSGSMLVYSTLLGGSNNDLAYAIALDSSGSAYVTGLAQSADFPTTPGAFQTSYGGGGDAFVTKFNSTGSALVYSTYLGGSGADGAGSIVVDTSGRAFVVGQTYSTKFPVTSGAFQISCKAGCVNGEAFVTEFNSAGSALVYSTYLGGSGGNGSRGDAASAIIVDGSGDAHVAGYTASPDFPTTPGAFQRLCPSAAQCGFITEFNSTGSALVYSTVLGSHAQQANGGVNGIALDASGNFYVTGITYSTGFPVTPDAFQTKLGGGQSDAFVTKFVPGDQVWPLAVDLGQQPIGHTSKPKKTVLTNSGTTPLNITNIQVTGTNSDDFAETNDCPTSLRAGNSCTITITFTPIAEGVRNAAVTITDDAPNSPQTVALTGIGLQALVKLSLKSLDFGDQVVFTSSTARPVTLSNIGNDPLYISSITATAQFVEANDCPKTLLPGAHCTIKVKFHPTTKGEQAGGLSVSDNAPGSPQTVALTGTGTYIQLTPTSLNFGTQPVGTKSLPQRITLTNKGSVPVSISGISITGTDPGDFAETNTCGKSVAAGGSCFIKVTFKPLVKGKRTADVSISDNGGGSPQKVSLTGTGT